jgi:hypothetical protein
LSLFLDIELQRLLKCHIGLLLFKERHLRIQLFGNRFLFLQHEFLGRLSFALDVLLVCCFANEALLQQVRLVECLLNSV